MRKFANPLALVERLIYKYQLPTNWINMGGVQASDYDISHLFACEIRNVPCTTEGGDGLWIEEGLRGKTSHSNSRKGDTKLTEAQLVEALDLLFRQRDCSYHNLLHLHSLLTIWHRNDDLWKGDCLATNAPEHQFRFHPATMLERMR